MNELGISNKKSCIKFFKDLILKDNYDNSDLYGNKTGAENVNNYFQNNLIYNITKDYWKRFRKFVELIYGN